MEFALEAGAEDILSEGSEIEVITSSENFETVLSILKTKFEERYGRDCPYA